MKLKNLLYLFLIPAMALSLTSCDDDDDIEGTWKYEGVEGVAVKTSDDSLTVAITKYLMDTGKDSEHTLVFDEKTMTIAYGKEVDGTYNYSFKDNKLTISWGTYSNTISFRVSGNTAILTESSLGEFIDDEDGEIDEWEIGYLMQRYPETLAHLEDIDLQTLKITEASVYKKYTKQ